MRIEEAFEQLLESSLFVCQTLQGRIYYNYDTL